MKKLLLLLMIFLSATFSEAAFTTTKTATIPIERETVPILEIKRQQERALMEKVVHMSVKDYEVFTGKKMNLVDRFTFRVIQKQFKRRMAEDLTSGFNLGGFFLGFLLGLLGVLGAYIFSRDRNFRKWTWIGLGGAIIFSLILLAISA